MSIQEIKAQFDADYLKIREIVVSGQLSLADAKEWLRLRGSMTADRMQDALNVHHMKFWKTRVLREDARLFGEEDE